jgi:hypothetical protein
MAENNRLNRMIVQAEKKYRDICAGKKAKPAPPPKKSTPKGKRGR